MDTENLLNTPDNNDYLNDALDNLYGNGDTDNADGVQDEPNADNQATEESEQSDNSSVEIDTVNQAVENNDNGENDGEKEPVILAKDGKHTIPYEKLTEARENAKTEKARADALQAELDALKSQANTKPATEIENADDDDYYGLFDDDAIPDKKQIEKIVQQAVANLIGSDIKQIQQQQQVIAIEKHFNAIYTAHPDADSIVESEELQAWIKTLPNYVQNSVNDILKNGTSGEVIEMLNDFKKWQKPQAEQQKITEIAKAKIDKVQASRVPNTLSDFPNAKSGGKSSEEVFNNLSVEDRVAFLATKSPDEMLEYIFN